MSSIITSSMVETRNRLLELIEPLSFEVFHKKPASDRWSIAQICHHLVLVELATVKAVKWGLKEDEEMSTERKNIIHILDRSKKFSAPKVVIPSDEAFEVKEIISMLYKSRKELLELIDSIESPAMLKERAVIHPAFGQLPLDQWIEAAPLHEQRHIEQIREML
ncbi:DinB family protein [Ornithinibacillus scapharcae]|uniref:DinB family protein n=1 Tax=Ornithinibacillus scapharcae TaxID=1147159 RepID=UPI000225B584|nr:DinB family protein [Ornithinibacillus scapharcae]